MVTRLALTIFLCLFVQLNAKNFNKTKLLDEWVVKLDGGHKRAVELANEYGLDLIGQVGSLTDYYHYKLDQNRKKRMAVEDVYETLDDDLKADPTVLWSQRQNLLIRHKRDYKANDDSTFIAPSDPLWKEMWYLNRNKKNVSLPDMNVTGAWMQGYSGRGVSVTFLDDGIEYDHPDLKANYDRNASYDFNDNDDDPMPRYEDTDLNRHGTRCAGEVGAVANNNLCNTGIAYNSRVGGIRILDGPLNDAGEASAISFHRDHISVYSSSWGPEDNGEEVEGPGPLATKALEDGANFGRSGKGSIFVWASGNGGPKNDSCACDGYINSIYTFSISSATEDGDKPWYLEECTSTLATTYSSGSEDKKEKSVLTTDIRHKCTRGHTGTSASAPMAAGIFALALEANSNLTWRDVMFLTVLSSRPKAIESNNYFENKRGFLVSSRYGFGLMDAGRMTELAKSWINVPKMSTCATESRSFKILNENTTYIQAAIQTDGCVNTTNEVRFIEQAQVVLSLDTSYRGAVEIDLTSPSGTKTLILPKRPKDSSDEGFYRWAFTTVQLWGENPIGNWSIEIKIDENEHDSFFKGSTFIKLNDVYLKIHGTKEEPIDYDHFLNTNKSISSTNVKEESDSKEADKHKDIKTKLKDFFSTKIKIIKTKTDEGMFAIKNLLSQTRLGQKDN